MEGFVYAPLKDASVDMRLLVLEAGNPQTPICGTILHKSTSQASKSYEALSYTWGDPDPSESIFLNGQQLKIARNLREALQQLRQPRESRTLWIDAICINQRDHAEKASQVRVMHHIYQNAIVVHAWLGVESGSSRHAFQTLSRLGSENNTRDVPYIPEMRERVRRTVQDPLLWDAITALGSREYWSRGWIVQEIGFAAEAIVRCGESTIDWSLLEEGAMCIVAIFDGSPVRPQFPDMFDSLLQVSSVLSRQGPGENKPPVSCLETLRAFKKCDVSNPRDQIYAFLNLPATEYTMNVPIRYDWRPETCYEEFAFWHIRMTGSLDILSYICTAQNESGRKIRIQGMGSWVPTWGRSGLPFQPLMKSSESQTRVFHASRRTRIRVSPREHTADLQDEQVKHSLLLSGRIVDKIKQLGIVVKDEPANEPLEPHCTPIVQWESMLNAFDIDNVYSRKPFDASPLSLRGIAQRSESTDIAELLGDTSPRMVISSPQILSLPEDTDPQRLALLDAFWRTLICDKFFYRQENMFSGFTRPDMPGRAGRNVWLLYQLWRDHDFSLPGLDLRDGFHEKAFSRAAKGACMNRRYMITENGYMGLAPAAASVGDSIALLEVKLSCRLQRCNVLTTHIRAREHPSC